MRCPYCKNKYEGLIFIFNTRCAKCGKKASNYNKKRYCYTNDFFGDSTSNFTSKH